MSVQLQRLFESFAETIDAPPAEDAGIGRSLAGLLAPLGDFDEVVVFAYRGKDRPIELFSTFAADEYAVFVTLYQAGPYLIDPFYHRALDRRRGVWRMRDIAPDRFFSSEYRRTYYVQTGLAEELGFFLPVGETACIVLSLMRKERTGGFSDKEFAVLGQAEPVVAALMRKGWGRIEQRFDAASAGLRTRRRKAPPSAADEVWQRLGLTVREAAIIELVLQGHSSESIGLKLSIATGTVKVHRRNVYRKLGISSQTQLMSLYLTNLAP